MDDRANETAGMAVGSSSTDQFRLFRSALDSVNHYAIAALGPPARQAS